MRTPPVVLSIAGTDSGGAAGLAADLTTFAALGAHGACVVTAVTAQDTTGVREIDRLPLGAIEAQLDSVVDDLDVAAVKTGLLGSPEVVCFVADRLAGTLPLVVDPVLRATTGTFFADRDVVAAYRDELVPRAGVVTPNLFEARALLRKEGDPADLALALHGLGPDVVLTGGPDPDMSETWCTDWVATDGRVTALQHAAIATRNDHGTGCTFSAALAVHLARGAELVDAARDAASFTTARLAQSRNWDLGRGRGSIGHLFTEQEN